jgi:hypothetical protein
LYHFIELLSVKSPKKRVEMFTLVRSQCLSVGDLRDHLVSRGLRSSIKKGGGRKAKPPVSPLVGLQRLSAHAERLVKYSDVAEPVIGQITEMPPNDIDDNLATRIEAAEKSAADAIHCLESVQELLKEAKARVGRVLSLRRKTRTYRCPRRNRDYGNVFIASPGLPAGRWGELQDDDARRGRRARQIQFRDAGERFSKDTSNTADLYA